jgi:hypothetical protein
MVCVLFESSGAVKNPKSEARNPKWFDKLTTLSHVEGQYSMIEIQMTKATGRRVAVLNIHSRANSPPGRHSRPSTPLRINSGGSPE